MLSAVWGEWGREGGSVLGGVYDFIENMLFVRARRPYHCY